MMPSLPCRARSPAALAGGLLVLPVARPAAPGAQRPAADSAAVAAVRARCARRETRVRETHVRETHVRETRVRMRDGVLP